MYFQVYWLCYWSWSCAEFWALLGLDFATFSTTKVCLLVSMNLSEPNVVPMTWTGPRDLGKILLQPNNPGIYIDPTTGRPITIARTKFSVFSILEPSDLSTCSYSLQQAKQVLLSSSLTEGAALPILPRFRLIPAHS